MVRYRKTIYKPNHPMAGTAGTIRLARYNLYEKLQGRDANCHWCGMKLIWTKERTKDQLCADHLDDNSLNDDPSNLVPSCRGCNANRKDDTDNGRKKAKLCATCSTPFLPKDHTSKFCSIKCIPRPKRGSKVEHGTRSRYNYGCRCSLCKKVHSDYMKRYEEKNPRSSR